MRFLINIGYSAYPRDLDYKKFRDIANEVGAFLLADIAHFNGLVAAGLLNNPFEYCDIVTMTTHKMLRGPRGAMIFYKLDKEGTMKENINSSVFPLMQGGPHNNLIAGIAVQLKDVGSDSYKEYARQVIKNSQRIAKNLMDKGYKLVTDGTDNHLILLDCKKFGLTGSKVQFALDKCHITTNKNSIYGDKSAVSPGGVRIGTPCLTSRGMKEDEMDIVSDFIDRVIQESINIGKKSGTKLEEFSKLLDKNETLNKIDEEVKEFSMKFPVPGINEEKFKNVQN